MRKTFTIYLALGIAAIILFSTCKKSNTAVNTNLVGTWSKSEFNNLEEYTFNSNNTFEYDVFAVDSVTNLTIGYRSRMVGKYSVSKTEITMYNTIYSANKNNTYGPTTDLVQIEGSATINYTFALGLNNLSFYFSCPANADCVPSPMVYYKMVYLTD